MNFDTILVTFEPSKEFVLQFHSKYVFLFTLSLPLKAGTFRGPVNDMVTLSQNKRMLNNVKTNLSLSHFFKQYIRILDIKLIGVKNKITAAISITTIWEFA